MHNIHRIRGHFPRRKKKEKKMIFQLEQVHFEVKYVAVVWKDVKTKYVQFGAKIGPFLIK